jgi:VRR-NUC domain
MATRLDWIEHIGARPLGVRAFVAGKRKLPAPGHPLLVEHFTFNFRHWDGEIGPWHEHFGKARGQVYSLDGADPVRSCNEVEVAKRLRTIRQHAYWFSQYQPSLVPDIWRPWVRSLGAQSPDWLTDLDRRLRQCMRSRRGGMPDVVAWDEEAPLATALFVECKGAKEHFSEAQEDWVAAAHEHGIAVSQVAVSVR